MKTAQAALALGKIGIETRKRRSSKVSGIAYYLNLLSINALARNFCYRATG